VKRPFLILGAVTLFAGAIVCLSDVRGQSGNAAQRTPRTVVPMKVAVIDLGTILRQYKKSEDLMEDVKAMAEAGNAKIKQLTGQGQELAKPLQEKSLEEDSPEYLERERKLLKLETYLKSLKSTTEREMKKQGARASLDVYEDLQEALHLYCEQNGYTLVLNFDREAASAPESQLQRSLGQAILFHQTRDDITDAILGYLNHKYEAANRSSNRPAAAVSPANSSAKSPLKTATESRPGRPQAR
jgi:Skp family chaperone for outer membrane proteins